jgi:pimeloyl-ACP methyl ester carboxylesterase
MNTTTHNLSTETVGDVDLSVTECGEGRAYLLLHGGAGPQSVAGFAELLAGSRPAHVITPTHPGFGLTHRPERLDSIAGLASLYIELLDRLELDEVTILGNSIGGWIATEIALQNPTRLTTLVLIDPVGIEVPGNPVVDFFSLTLDEVTQLSYHDPEKFRIDPATMPPAVREAMPGNRASLAIYGGASMTDPNLVGRLGGITTPTLVVWGEADRIVNPDYGRAFATAIPNARFHLLSGAGHVPQIETPDELLDVAWSFSRTNEAVA